MSEVLGLNRVRTKSYFLKVIGLPEDMVGDVFSRISPIQHREDGESLYLESTVDKAIEQVCSERHRLPGPADEAISEKENPNMVALGATMHAMARSGGPLLKTKDAARYLAISERQVQYEVQRGNISVVRFGKASIRFTKEDLDAFVKRCRTPASRQGRQSWQA